MIRKTRQLRREKTSETSISNVISEMSKTN